MKFELGFGLVCNFWGKGERRVSKLVFLGLFYFKKKKIVLFVRCAPIGVTLGIGFWRVSYFKQIIKRLLSGKDNRGVKGRLFIS